MSCLACLACQGLCSGAACLVSCCGRTAPLHHGVRLLYFVFFLATSVAAWALAAFGQEIPYIGKRLGPLSAYNLTFGFAVFHLLFALVVLGVTNAHSAQGKLHNGWWGPKFIAWLALLVGFLFLPPQFLKVYPYVSLVGSIIFTIIQLFMLVDFAHTWNEAWVKRFHETEHKIWYYLLLGGTLLFYCAIIAGSALMFVFFSNGGPDCPYKTRNSLLIGLNLALIVVCSIASILPAIQDRNPRASIFTSAIVGVYTTYLVGSSIFSLPVAGGIGHELCHYQMPAHKEVLNYLTLVFGALITFVAVAFSSMSAGSHSGSVSTTSSTASERTLLVNRSDEENAEDHHSDDIEVQQRKAAEKNERELLNLDDHHHHDEHHFEPVAYNYSWFHIVMLLGSMYIGSLMSNWAGETILFIFSPLLTVHVFSQVVANSLPLARLTVDKSIVSFWLKGVSGWVVLALYFWTLIAPIVLPNRDFGFET